MSEVWRLIDSGHKTSGENMAFSQALMTECSQGLHNGTFRFFQCSSKCVLLGYYQSVEQEIREQYCHAHGFDINRRLTGGEALYWDDSAIGWELIVHKDSQNIVPYGDKLLTMVNQAVVEGLGMIGIDGVTDDHVSGIQVGGRKLAWTGGMECDEVYLFQGLIPVKLDVATMLRVLHIPTEKLVDKEVLAASKRLTCLERLQKTELTTTEIVGSMVQGFSKIFNVKFEKQGIKEELSKSVANYLPRFTSNDWIYRKKFQEYLKQEGQRQTLVKSENHNMYISLTVNETDKRLKRVQICGDFYAYPGDIIEKIEMGLENISADYHCIEDVIRKYLVIGKTCILGFKPEDFISGIMEAVEKTKFIELGAYADEVSDLYLVASSLGELQQRMKIELTAGKELALLLPYCAKMTTCKFRYTEGCSVCGQCDIGDAYRLAQKFGLKPITIQNYEMLEATLKKLKLSGSTVFVGLCCTTFIAKHRNDFERIGLPGLLINVDNSTCYDLGREREAYQGLFENQTRLKLELIKRVLTKIGEY